MTPLSYASTAGFPELRMSRAIDADFETAADRLFRWGVQRSGLFRVHPTQEIVETGAEVALGFGPWTFRCRVIDAFSEPNRCGFTYGTLPGHVERGEETFTLERLQDGRVLFLIDAKSQPARFPTLRPVIDLPRRARIRRFYLRALDD